MKRSHAPLLRHDFHPIGGNELETVIRNTGGMLCHPLPQRDRRALQEYADCLPRPALIDCAKGVS